MEQVRRTGMPIPEKIKNAPTLRLGLELFFSGFTDLSSSRGMSGFGEGMIPWGAIEDYCERWDLDEDTTEDMHYHLGELDTARAKYYKRKESKKNPGTT